MIDERTRPAAHRVIVQVACIACLQMGGATMGQVAFTEVATEAGLDVWHSPPAPFLDFYKGFMTAGGAVGDFDNDGWPDLFVIDGGSAPDHLYLNNGDGTFTDAGAAWGLTDAHWGVGAAVGDYDGDGWLDLYVTSFSRDGGASVAQAGAHRLYRNTGKGGFVETTADAGVGTTSPTLPDGFTPAFGDYDLDGDLDLFVTAWSAVSAGNVLFQNQGDGTFVDVTVAAGLDPGATRGFTPRFVDMDGDRYPELLVTADFQTSRYYRNRGDGTFEDVTDVSGTGLDGNGMGSTIGDVDGDGRLDWYVTSIWTSSTTTGVPGTGNMLYMNVDDHLFEEVATEVGVHDGGWGWGTTAVDLDHDGWIDLVETNGWGTYGDDDFTTERVKVFMNTGADAFEDAAGWCGLEHDGQGRGLVRFDFDRDGDQDLAIFSTAGRLELYRNDLESSNAWLTIHLETTASPALAPRGVGSLVRVTHGEQSWVRSVASETTYLGQSELSAHFGLGATAGPVEVRVAWANGRVTELTGVDVNQILTISARPADLDGDGAVGFSDLLLVLSTWGPCPPPPTACAGDVDDSGGVGIVDLLNVLAAWET